MKSFKYLDLIAVVFVCILLTSNIVSTKIINLGPFTFDGGTIIFPLSYIFGDILTEVYGYKRSRKVIWMGFLSAFIMSIIIILVGVLPSATGWDFQESYNQILGFTPRIVAASLIAYLAGEFSNAYIMAKLKIKTQGKYLWFRTIGSTLVGELLDTMIFVFIAFWGVFDTDMMITLFISNYIFKVLVEILFTPFTYLIVDKLKKVEKEDFYDKDTNFSPFIL